MPFVENGKDIFLKTVIPSRKAKTIFDPEEQELLEGSRRFLQISKILRGQSPLEDENILVQG